LRRLRVALGLILALVALAVQASRSPRGHMFLPAVVGGSGLLFLTSLRAGQPEAATWVLMVGRTLQSMTPDAPWALGGWAPSLQLCLSLAALGWAVVHRASRASDRSAGPLIVAVCAFALAVPITPLSIAALTLLGVAALPTHAQPTQVREPAHAS
jgi:hypothetical protein